MRPDLLIHFEAGFLIDELEFESGSKSGGIWRFLWYK